MAMADAAGGMTVPGGARGAALFEGSGASLIVFIWAIFAAATAVGGFPATIDHMSTDDAMRLVEVRDLLGGQGWFDLTQHRLNPPDGVPMHWSRLIDLPIALMLGLSERLLAPETALKFTLTAWPLLLLLPTLFAGASASRSIAGPQAAILGAFLLVMSPGVTNRFGPSAIDHHGAQVMLALTMLACALKIDRSVKAAVGAGLCAAAMMAIGMETLPHVAACAAFIALRWGVEGDPMKRGARAFGLSFALGSLAVAALTVAPERWTAPVCDALGVGHLAAAMIGGFGLGAATALSRGGAAARFAALAQIGVAVIAGVALISPECLSSPYAALPERLIDNWLVRVQEAHSFWSSARDEPSAGFAIAFPMALLIGVAVWAVATAPHAARWPVWTVVAMFATGCAVTAWQIRGASLAFALGGPLLPAAILAIGRTGDRVRAILAVAALNPATLALAGLGVAHVVGLPPVEEEGATAKLCPTADYRALTRLPQGLALNTIDTGPYILAFSPHAVVAAPYHRNVDGLMAELDAFQGSEEAARAVAVSRGAAYVVVCPLDGGVRPDAEAYPEGFSAMLTGNRPPAWLEPVDLGPQAKLKAYKVLAGR